MCIWDCGNISDCMNEVFCPLAYPTFIVVCFAVWYSLLRWSSTCWCEHMQGTPADNREVMVPLHNQHRLDFSFFGLSLGLCPMYSICFITLPVFARLFNCFLLASWCAWFCRGWVKDPKTALLYYLCVAFLLITFIN